MSSRVDLIARGFEAYNSGHISADDPVVANIAVDAEWHSMIARLPGEPHRGPSGFLSWYSDLQDVFERATVSSHEYRELDERVLALGRFRAAGRTSGAQIDEPILHVFDFDPDGKIRRYEAHLSPEPDLLRELGWTG